MRMNVFVNVTIICRANARVRINFRGKAVCHGKAAGGRAGARL